MGFEVTIQRTDVVSLRTLGAESEKGQLVQKRIDELRNEIQMAVNRRDEVWGAVIHAGHGTLGLSQTHPYWESLELKKLQALNGEQNKLNMELGAIGEEVYAQKHGVAPIRGPLTKAFPTKSGGVDDVLEALKQAIAFIEHAKKEHGDKLVVYLSEE